jgi:hypothetical protein
MQGMAAHHAHAGSETPPSLAEHRSTALPADLAAYLDWPLYFPDESVSCHNFPACKHPDCNNAGWGPVAIASARRMTVREFLADIRAHAGGLSVTTLAGARRAGSAAG